MTDTPDEDGVQMKIIWNSDLVQEVLDALNALVKEARFQFLDGLIRVWAIEPANVAACFIDLDPDSNDRIQYYRVQEGGFTMGLDTGNLDDVMKYTGNSVPVQFEYGEKHNWTFNITTSNIEVDLAGIDPDSVRQDPDHPNLEDKVPAGYIVEGRDLDEAVNLNDMFSDHATITVEDHQVKMWATGDTDSGSYTLDEADGEVEFIKHPDQRVESMFSLDYLNEIRKVLKHYETVVIYSGEEFPIMLKTDLFDYMIAPRVQKV